MKGIRHLIDISDLTTEEIDGILAVAEDIMRDRAKYAHACEGKKIATLFFEPSTRTRLSFEAAMMELGGKALGFASASNSSTTKGESVMDTIRTVSAYADIIAMRHSLEGAALAASRRSIVPVINAGDGGHCHPTQTLADLLTIKDRHGRLDHLTIGICGDLKYGRTVHSLINALTRYEGNRFVMISPPELTIPNYVRYEIMEPRGAVWSHCTNIEDCIADLDVLYMTRIQREFPFRRREGLLPRAQSPQDLHRRRRLCLPQPQVRNRRRDRPSPAIFAPRPGAQHLQVRVL